MKETSLSAGENQEAQRRRIITSIKAKADQKKSTSEHLADHITAFFGSVTFLLLNLALFIAWIVLNIAVVPGLEPFDPFPFVGLTTLVSLEAIILSVFVLISQNRATRIADLREEVNLQLTAIDEQETTKILAMLTMLLEKSGIDISDDLELQEMIEETDTEKLEQAIQEQIG